ncbi:oxidoreductase [Paenibacillus lentus]|uniref:Oxidoreductase n=1 Tax=Paenibacillus lentus TaxID=1338368 RepID=A0A3S8RSJ1_9BACL|nr:oxidoreductase [Paenibacillus lentus]AZK45810.1 oxidoreductase [Paenibacillus lentus]
MAIQVGLIGFGLSGSVFHAPLIDWTEGLKLAAVVSSQPGKVNESYPDARVYPDVEALLNDQDIQVVVVSSPNLTHYDYATQALEAGKHVVVEKPFTNSSEEAERLIALAREKKLLLTVYHNRRWDNDFLTISRLLDTRALGNISYYEAHFDRYRPEVTGRWREQDLPGSGILYDLGSHLIDQALTLFGKPNTVWADLRKERRGGKVNDYFHLVLGYSDLRVVLHAGSLVREPGPRFILHGDRGSFIKHGFDPQEAQLRKGLGPGDTDWGRDAAVNYGRLTTDIGGLAVTGTVDTLNGSYEMFYRKLADAIRYGGPSPVLAEDARDVIRIIELAMESHSKGRVLTLEHRNR